MFKETHRITHSDSESRHFHPMIERVSGERKIDALMSDASLGAWEMLQPHVSTILGGVREKILAIEDQSEGMQKIKALVEDQEKFADKVRIHQYSDMDPLRLSAPESWNGLFMLSSAHHQAELALLNHWVSTMSDDDFRAMGMGKAEFELALDIGRSTIPFITKTHKKQMELADSPGGSEKSPDVTTRGEEKLYKIEDKEGNLLNRPYIDMFPETYPQLVAQLSRLSAKTATLVEAGELPESYKSLSTYLQTMSDVYGSTETNPEKVTQIWDHLAGQMTEVAKSGCPIIISVADGCYVARDANVMDAEIRVAIQTPYTKELMLEYEHYRAIASAYIEGFASALSGTPHTPDVSINQLLAAGGSNLYWRTQGESSDGTIVCHANTTEQVASVMSMPLIANVFGEADLEGQTGKLPKLFVETLITHELGHSVLSLYDNAIHERVGEGPETNSLEEMKAELMGMKFIVDRTAQTGDTQHLKDLFMATIACGLDYAINRATSSGYGTNMYADVGKVMLAAALDAGSIVPKDEKYIVVDVIAGFDAWMKLADEVCAVYANPETTPKSVIAFIQEKVGCAEANEKYKDFVAKATGKVS